MLGTCSWFSELNNHLFCASNWLVLIWLLINVYMYMYYDDAILIHPFCIQFKKLYHPHALHLVVPLNVNTLYTHVAVTVDDGSLFSQVTSCVGYALSLQTASKVLSIHMNAHIHHPQTQS